MSGFVQGYNSKGLNIR
jgi:uncharacterized protein YecE (DUF72 family)